MFVARARYALLVSALTFTTSSVALADESAPKKVAQKGNTQKTRRAPGAAPAPAARPVRRKAPPPPPPPEEVEEAAPEPPPPAARSSAPAPSSHRSAPADTPSDAEEDDHGDKARPVSVAPLLGYASESMKLGVGVRGGYTLPMGLYVGGTFIYHLGSSAEGSSALGTIESSARFIVSGAEVGYSIPVGPVTVRPYAGVGLLVAMISQKAGSQESSDSATSLAFWPGCTALYSIPHSPAFVGIDSRLLLATEGSGVAFGAFATGGMRF
jgi:hypothetical protein